MHGCAEHLADGLKAHAADGGECLTGQRGLPRAAGPGTRSPGHSTGGQVLAHAPSLGPLLPRYPDRAFWAAPIRDQASPGIDITTLRESPQSVTQTGSADLNAGMAVSLVVYAASERVICAAGSFIGAGGVVDQVVAVSHGDGLSAVEAEHGEGSAVTT